jgi:hypothetical protein
MDIEEFRALAARAVELHASQGARAKSKVSLDAVFLALAANSPASRRVRKATEEEAPQWFHDTLKSLKGTGERITVGRFLMLAGKFPATRSDALNVARWLREAGYTPRKTGGNLLFEF